MYMNIFIERQFLNTKFKELFLLKKEGFTHSLEVIIYWAKSWNDFTKKDFLIINLILYSKNPYIGIKI